METNARSAGAFSDLSKAVIFCFMADSLTRLDFTKESKEDDAPIYRFKFSVNFEICEQKTVNFFYLCQVV